MSNFRPNPLGNFIVSLRKAYYLLKSPSSNTTAVLIFANSHGVDAARKGIPQSHALFKSLNDEIVDKVERTGLSYFLYTEELQIGSDFGARFTAAIQSIFSKGFDSVITIGNDTPNLSSAAILKAYQNLQEGKTVIGPSTDGGIYLLGINKNRFEPAGFCELPWQRQNLFQETARFFMRRGMLHQLPRLTDIDSIEDIKIVINQHRSISTRLFQLLLAIIGRRQLTLAHRYNSYVFFETNQPFNKGSPYR